MEDSWRGVLVKVDASVGKFAEGSLLLELWVEALAGARKLIHFASQSSPGYGR